MRTVASGTACVTHTVVYVLHCFIIPTPNPTPLQQGTLVIGWVSIVLGVLNLLGALFPLSPVGLIQALVSIILGILIVVAVQRQQPALLLPAQIMLVISAVFSVLFAGFMLSMFIIGLVTVTASSHHSMHATGGGSAVIGSVIGVMAVVLATIYALMAAMDVWFYRVLAQYCRFVKVS